MSNVLFLDDMEERHKAFRRVTDGLDIKITHVYTAADAIKALDAGSFDQVFLDHDLSLDDIMMEAGAQGKEPSGMVVVDHILQMDRTKLPEEIYVHSCNGPAAEIMAGKLRDMDAPITIRRLPFPLLCTFIEATNDSKES